MGLFGDIVGALYNTKEQLEHYLAELESREPPKKTMHSVESVQMLMNRASGDIEESIVASCLKNYQRFNPDSRVLRNLYIPKHNGDTSEIDSVLITKKGIFVIECKNFSGYIFGNEHDHEWTQSLSNKQKNRFYNPIKQNQTHIRWLKQYLGTDVYCCSLIVFSTKCTLQKITVYSHDVHVIYSTGLIDMIKRISAGLDDTLDVEQIYQKLTALTKANDAVKLAHINSIHERFGTPARLPEAKSVPEPVSEPGRCPRCGAPLVLRTAKRGANAGKQFYGCTSYPNCKYMKNIE